MAFPTSEHKCPKCPAMVKVVQAGPPPVSGRRRISCLRCGHVWHVEAGNNSLPKLLPEVFAIHPSIVAVKDTGDEKVHHPYTAYNQGHEAFEAGYPVEANPYSGKDKWLADWWEAGWLGYEEGDELPDF